MGCTSKKLGQTLQILVTPAKPKKKLYGCNTSPSWDFGKIVLNPEVGSTKAAKGGSRLQEPKSRLQERNAGESKLSAKTYKCLACSLKGLLVSYVLVVESGLGCRESVGICPKITGADMHPF